MTIYPRDSASLFEKEIKLNGKNSIVENKSERMEV